jgi:hypothetical protein
MEGPLHRQAATLRAKYFKGRYRVAPGHIGFHPSNRGGQAPNGERCVTLLLTILRDGYDPQEGDHAGILVQEVPGRRTVQAFNDAALHGDPLLTPSIEGVAAQYGSLSHSHLNQVFKHILGRLLLGVPAVADREGRACVELLRHADEKFAKACEEGLMWEILGHELTMEEGEIIQAAANSKNAVAMPQTTMELVSSLSRWCSKSSAIAEKLTFASARNAMMVTYPDMACDEEFVNVFKLVVDLGADGAPFLASLQSFASRFVNPQVRRLRLHAFSSAAGLPLECPRLKIAVLKWAYKQEPRFGFCPVPECGKINQLPSSAVADAETVLHNAHVGMASLIGELPNEYYRAQWLGHVDANVASAVLEAKSGATRASLSAAIGVHVTAMCVKLAKLLGEGGTEKVQAAASKHFPSLVEWPAADSGTPPALAGDEVLPKVIHYDADGKAMGAQVEKFKTEEPPEEILVAPWVGMIDVQNTHAEACARGIVMSALQMTQASYSAKMLALPVEVIRHKGVVSVVAKSAIGKHALVAPVAIMNASSLVPAARCTHPRALRVALKENAGGEESNNEWPLFLAQREYMITPELKLPSTPAIAGNGHDWKVSNYAHLFWVIPRDDSEEKWNCEVFNIEVTQALALQQPTLGTVARAFSVTVPALRNTRAIAEGEKVVLKWPKPKEVAKPPRAGTTWWSNAKGEMKGEMKRRKLVHASDQGGPSR